MSGTKKILMSWPDIDFRHNSRTPILFNKSRVTKHRKHGLFKKPINFIVSSPTHCLPLSDIKMLDYKIISPTRDHAREWL